MKLSQIIGGGGAGLKLRGAQTYNDQAGGLGGINISGLNLSGAGQTVLSLTGRWALDFAVLATTSSTGTWNMELVVDGETKYNGALTASTRIPLIGTSATSSTFAPISVPIISETSLTIKITRSTADATTFSARAFAII